MELSQQQKNAIENLLILVDYIKENSIYTDSDGEIIEKSIAVAEELIGKRTKSKGKAEPVSDFLAEEIKKRFSS